MKGWRTVAWNASIAAVVALLTWAVGEDWTAYVSPTVAVIIVAAANLGLRFVTNTPVGISKPT